MKKRDVGTVCHGSSVVSVHRSFRSRTSPSLKSQALSDPLFFHDSCIPSVESIFCREKGSNHLSCILFTVVTSNPLLMASPSMRFDSSLKIRSLSCYPHPTVVVSPFLSGNDEYRSEALHSCISRSIKGGMSFLEGTVLFGGAL